MFFMIPLLDFKSSIKFNRKLDFNNILTFYLYGIKYKKSVNLLLGSRFFISFELKIVTLLINELIDFFC